MKGTVKILKKHSKGGRARVTAGKFSLVIDVQLKDKLSKVVTPIVINGNKYEVRRTGRTFTVTGNGVNDIYTAPDASAQMDPITGVVVITVVTIVTVAFTYLVDKGLDKIDKMDSFEASVEIGPDGGRATVEASGGGDSPDGAGGDDGGDDSGDDSGSDSGGDSGGGDDGGAGGDDGADAGGGASGSGN